MKFSPTGTCDAAWRRPPLWWEGAATYSGWLRAGLKGKKRPVTFDRKVVERRKWRQTNRLQKLNRIRPLRTFYKIKPGREPFFVDCSAPVADRAVLRPDLSIRFSRSGAIISNQKGPFFGPFLTAQTIPDVAESRTWRWDHLGGKTITLRACTRQSTGRGPGGAVLDRLREPDEPGEARRRKERPPMEWTHSGRTTHGHEQRLRTSDNLSGTGAGDGGYQSTGDGSSER